MGLVTQRPESSQLFPWYDSVWLSKYTRAREIVQRSRPEALSSFDEAFQVLRTKPDFETRMLDRVFDDPTIEEIKRVMASLRPTDLELHEARRFGRFVVHDHPYVDELQHGLVPLVSEVVGEPVESAYNFLSLYGAQGVCDLHMDSPQSKWTLDLCLDQSAPWPIYFSQVQPWPESDGGLQGEVDWRAHVKQDRSLRFTGHSLLPGQAVVFSGSSQWHYRDAIPLGVGRRFCDLLFFHFIPLGTAELVQPDNWARLFRIPELGA